MTSHAHKIRKFAVALALFLVFMPLVRILSPKIVLDGQTLYLAWLPLSFMVAMILVFGRIAALPLVISLFVLLSMHFTLSALQIMVFMLCIAAPLLLCSAIVRFILGSRWRYALPNDGLGIRIFWLCFAAPCLMKASMFLAGRYIDFPAPVAVYFGHASLLYNIIDVLNLIAASLIFTNLFYYPLRVALSPRFARALWWRCKNPYLLPGRRLYTLGWIAALAGIVGLFCIPTRTLLISSYLVPLIFIFFTHGIRHLGQRMISFSWAIAAWFLLTWNEGYLFGVRTGMALSFTLSVFISFTVCMLYMALMYHKSEWAHRVYYSQALTDPLTGLPNLRALENHLQEYQTGTLCCLRMGNLEFLSRHYGMMMRVHCKRVITSELRPLLHEGETVFQLPGCELLLYLRGPEAESRLTHMVNLLNSRKISWHKSVLEIEYSASWGVVSHYDPDELQRMLGQLSYLAEQATNNRVLSLDHRQALVTGQTTERVLMLHKVKQALQEEQGLQLYVQPIHNRHGEGYYEVLSRLNVENETITPDKFIPVVAEFNMSVRFDMAVLEKLVAWLSRHPATREQARFSVNLMPYTLMQKDIAGDIVALFRSAGVSPCSVVIEVTEAQAFSDEGVIIANINQLRESGLRIAIDDFGTGYANYARLKNLQADIIKIDGCFVRDIGPNNLDAMIVKSICELAQAQSLSVVAEYVETQQQRDILLSLGVEYLQGYLIGRPQPLTEQLDA
ncbi:EAL domain-containing protein [Entomohabitans teleogrylli]|uniref:EAL domain-containing protein n=1 Tax=Entomohabitans teleogrylli TaxID=1384589 RepID=UPI00073D430F|nr:EAL domain-containing protein [Entomohabitans teleogrylli]